MKQWLKSLSLGAVSLAVSLVLAEAVFVWYEEDYLQGEPVINERVIDLAELNYNDTMVPLRKPRGEFRVLSFGDSFAYATVKYPFSYHGVASGLLNEALDSKGVTVRIINLGEPAISFYQYIKAYQQWAPVIEHDAVIFNVYLGNDLLDVAYGYVPRDAPLDRILGNHPVNLQTGQPRELNGEGLQVKIRRKRVRVPRKYPLRMMDYLYAWWHSDFRKPPSSRLEAASSSPYSLAPYLLPKKVYYETNRLILDNYDPAKVEQLQEGYKAAIEFARMASSVRQSGGKVLIMLAPPEVEIEPNLREKIGKKYNIDLTKLDLELPASRISRAIRAVDKDLEILKLSSMLRCAARAKQNLYYKTDTHWSVEGNRLVGEVLAWYISMRWLKEYFSEPLANLDKCVANVGSQQ